MADEKVDLTQTETKKTWKESLGAFLTKKGAVIGAALVVLGGILGVLFDVFRVIRKVKKMNTAFDVAVPLTV